MSTVRLPVPNSSGRELLLDLLASTSGIEREIVAAAEMLDPFPKMKVPVAACGHLIAMKVLAESEVRLKDRIDLQSLLSTATAADIALATSAVVLIAERKSSVTKDLSATLERFIAQHAPQVAR